MFFNWLRPAPRRRPGRAHRSPRCFRPGLDPLEDRLALSTFTVNTTLDVVNPSDGKLSLREAITRANQRPGADTIVLPAGVYKIALDGMDTVNQAGDFDVTDTVTIRGAGAGRTIIDAQQKDRVFDVFGTAPSSIRATFVGLTIRNGNTEAGGGIVVANADLVVKDCVITGNRASDSGGGISNIFLPGTGNVTLLHTNVSGNVAGDDGGGLAVRGDAQGMGSNLIIRSSTIRGNVTAFNGGGIYAGRVSLSNTTVIGNHAGNDAGGVYSESTATLKSSRVSGNTADDDGGGLFAETTAVLINSTVRGNRAGIGVGGGIFTSGSAILSKSSVRGNSSADAGGGIFAITATLSKSTLSGNTSIEAGGGLFATTATIVNSTVRGNAVLGAGAGGGIRANSAVTIKSTVSGNAAGGNGGGIAATTATLMNSTVSGNTAGAAAGGIFAQNSATVTNSTVSRNISNADGGGIAAGTANLTNSTLSGNTARGNGGGIILSSFLSDTATLLNVTITKNSAQAGGGVFVPLLAVANVKNTLIAQNLDFSGISPDVSGAFISQGHNLIGDPSGSSGFTDGANGDLVGSSVKPRHPKLGPLAKNGGSTLTHALLPGSPAIDRGDNNGAPARDQRGVRRPRNGDGKAGAIVDIGAFER